MDAEAKEDVLNIFLKIIESIPPFQKLREGYMIVEDGKMIMIMMMVAMAMKNSDNKIVQ